MVTSVSILGSGNVASHLVRKLAAEEISIDCIFSRNKDTGIQLARAVGAKFTDSLSGIPENSNAYIFMMSDTANVEYAQQVKFHDNAVLIHTSGSLPKEVFTSKKAAVMYPFQTFSRDVEVKNYSEIPICIEATNAETLQEVRELAQKISPKIYELSFEQRKILHIAGVFASNFMNHSVFLGQKMLSDNDIPIEILNPLLSQSFAKIMNGDAYSSQTGPAARGDRKVIESHVEMLSVDTKLAEIYKIMSESILKTYNK